MAHPAGEVNWPSEDIPNHHRLFLRVNVGHVPSGLHPGIFRENKGSMSTDWEKYSTPEETRQRAPRPERTGVVGLNVGDIRAIAELSVMHSPVRSPANRAHTDVFGIVQPDPIETTRIRSLLFERCRGWLVEPEQAA
jgi:hypothetical protein